MGFTNPRDTTLTRLRVQPIDSSIESMPPAAVITFISVCTVTVAAVSVPAATAGVPVSVTMNGDFPRNASGYVADPLNGKYYALIDIFGNFAPLQIASAMQGTAPNLQFMVANPTAAAIALTANTKYLLLAIGIEYPEGTNTNP